MSGYCSLLSLRSPRGYRERFNVVERTMQDAWAAVICANAAEQRRNGVSKPVKPCPASNYQLHLQRRTAAL